MPKNRNASRIKTKQRDHGTRRNQNDQCGRNAGKELLHRDQHREAEGADRQRQHMSLRQLIDDLDQARDNTVLLERESEHLANLSQQDTDGDPVQESDQDRLGQKIRHSAEPEQACRDTQQAREKRQRNRERQIQIGVARG
jgi:hypothetical protein